MKMRLKRVKVKRTRVKKKNIRVKEVSNEVSMEDLKHAPFLNRLTKESKANLNAEIYDVFR